MVEVNYDLKEIYVFEINVVVLLDVIKEKVVYYLILCYLEMICDLVLFVDKNIDYVIIF